MKRISQHIPHMHISTILCVCLHICLHIQLATTYTTIHQINAETATRRLTKWIEFTKRDGVNRCEMLNELPTLYTMAGCMHGIRSGKPKPTTSIPWTRCKLGDKIIVLADETMPVPFSINKLDMTIDTYIGVCEICMGKDGEMVVSLQQLVVHPNLRLLYDTLGDSPVNGYGVAFKHTLMESVTDAEMRLNLQPLMEWGDGRYFLHLNEDVLFEW